MPVAVCIFICISAQLVIKPCEIYATRTGTLVLISMSRITVSTTFVMMLMERRADQIEREQQNENAPDESYPSE